MDKTKEVCPVCKGTKITESHNKCGLCDGNGQITKKKKETLDQIKKDLTARLLRR